MASFIEEVEKKKQALARKEAPEKEAEPDGPTIEDIRKNSEQMRLLEIYLESQGDQELIARLDKEELTNEDITTLAERRKGFLALNAEIENTKGKLDQETITALAQNSPELKELAAVRGPKSIQEAIMRNLTDAAMGGNGKYKDIRKAVENLARVKTGIDQDSKKMLRMAASHGLSQAEYMNALTRQSSDGMALENAIVEKIGRLRSIFTSAEEIEEKASALDKNDLIEKQVVILKKMEENLGIVLRSFILDDKVAHKDHFRGLGGFKTPPAAKAKTEVTSPEPKKEEIKISEGQEREGSKEAFKIGDAVFWEPNGVFQWKEPRVIINIEEDSKSKRKYALFKESKTGTPLDQLVAVPKNTPTEVAKQEGGQKITSQSFLEALKIKNGKLSEQEIKDIRKEWMEYNGAHSGDQGFSFESGLSDFTAGYAQKKFTKEGGGLFSFIAYFFLPDKIRDLIRK